MEKNYRELYEELVVKTNYYREALLKEVKDLTKLQAGEDIVDKFNGQFDGNNEIIWQGSRTNRDGNQENLYLMKTYQKEEKKTRRCGCVLYSSLVYLEVDGYKIYRPVAWYNPLQTDELMGKEINPDLLP